MKTLEMKENHRKNNGVYLQNYSCHTVAIRGSRGLMDYAPCFCLEMRLGERTCLTKFGELTQDRQHPELTPETRIMILIVSPLMVPCDAVLKHKF